MGNSCCGTTSLVASQAGDESDMASVGASARPSVVTRRPAAPQAAPPPPKLATAPAVAALQKVPSPSPSPPPAASAHGRDGVHTPLAVAPSTPAPTPVPRSPAPLPSRAGPADSPRPLMRLLVLSRQGSGDAPPAPQHQHTLSGTVTDANYHRARPSLRAGRPPSWQGDELVTDTFVISATSLSDDDDDMFSVDVSLPTHSLAPVDRAALAAGYHHMRTYSDATSEIDFTAASFDRPGRDRTRGVGLRELAAMEAERRARLTRSAAKARRAAWVAFCKGQATHERAAMLRRFFLERFALMVWETVARESAGRRTLAVGEAGAWSLLLESATSPEDSQHWEAGTGPPALVVAKASSMTSQHVCESTRANGATDADATSNSSLDEASTSRPRRPRDGSCSSPPSSCCVAPRAPGQRPSTAPAATGGASDDLATTGSSTDRGSHHSSSRRVVSPATADPRKIMRAKTAAKVGGWGAGASTGSLAS